MHYINNLQAFIKSNSSQGLNQHEHEGAVQWFRNMAVESAMEQIKLYKVGKGRLGLSD